jgi:Tfp pilus assembly protein FimT
MTLLVAGILLGIGVPNVMEFSRNASITAAANDFVTAALMARTEAVKRQAPVTFCLSDNPLAVTPTCAPGAVFGSLTRGFVVFVDENNNVDADGARILTDGTDGNGVIDGGELVLSQTAAPGASSSVRVSANCGYVSYAATGFTRQAGALCNPAVRAVLFCDDRGERRAAGDLSSARLVLTGRSGRPQALAERTAFTPFMAGFNTGGAGCPVAP